MANEADTAAMPSEARTIHKLRMRIIPFVFVLYVISFLDRINISFAALTINKEPWLLIFSSCHAALPFFIGTLVEVCRNEYQ